MAPWRMEWIGTGSGLNPVLGNTCFLLRGQGDRMALVDCGYTVPGRLLELDYIDRITDIVVTHMHSDHIGGLEAFGFYHRHVAQHLDGARPHLHIATAKENLEMVKVLVKKGGSKSPLRKLAKPSVNRD